jgi:hypothetical protein
LPFTKTARWPRMPQNPANQVGKAEIVLGFWRWRRHMGNIS